MRLTQLDADHRGDALAHVLSGQRLGLLFKKVVRVRIIVDRPGQRGLEPDQMRATLPCIDVVRERENVFGISVVVLKRHFQDHVRLLYLDEDRLVQRGFGLVQVLHERDNPALITKDFLLFAPLVGERDGEAFIEKCQLPQPLGQHIEAEIERLKDLPVRLEGDLRAALLGLPRDLQGSKRFAPLVPLLEDLAFLPDFQLQPFRERINDRDAYAVQSARDGIRSLLELSSGMEHRQRHFRSRFVLRGMHAGRNAPAVVDDGDAAVQVDGRFDLVPEPCHVLVDAVVHRLVDEVVQPVHAGAADIHRGTFSYGVESL